DVYPAELQSSDAFCKELEARKDAKSLLEPFTVVRGDAAKLFPVPYSDAYKDEMTTIAKELTAAADGLHDPGETALVTYLRAAAKSFTTNDWLPADEAWAKMTVDNSKWFVRIGPDEVYWEPCAQKAGFHLTFARINQGSKQWQSKLVPVQQEMEAAIAQRAGAPYKARKVTFHLPDFIDVVVNAGDDRPPLGATIGQSLPNWGPVANEGRGRTIAMVNLYGDPDSQSARRAQADSVFDAASMKLYAGTQEPSLLATILHEATHNLGPAHEYKVGGKTADEVFGGPVASVLEELKAQTGALFLLEFLRGKGLISDQLAQQSFADSIVWALGHVSQGMYTGSGARKTYGNVAAIQIGFLIEHGALTWNDQASANNGTDKGAFTIHGDKLVGAADEMMKAFAGIKARGDKPAADELIKRYVDGTIVPHKLIAERFLRFPKASFVYAVSM
ncbi:MAG: Nudix hydrolase 3, partial [Myxococcales bacterium]|nr:Nudix hydrolase 3 [Myxococcales bacterium]